MAKAPHVTRLAVALPMGAEDVPVGTLAWSRTHRAAAFECDADFVARGLAISPLNLKLGPGVRIAPAGPFAGLFGVFADSLPDGWGRLLLDRRISQLGGDPGALTPLDRLAMIGTRGMGALTYRPEQLLGEVGDQTFDIDVLAAHAAAIVDGSTRDIERLLGANGGSAGARPKILVLRDKARGDFRLDAGDPQGPDDDAWLIKFGTRTDPRDAGRIEQAIAITARAAGIQFPETMLVEGASGTAHFATRRFDRPDGKRVHVHTLAGLLDADFRQPSVDYEGFLKATRLVTGRASDVEEAFRRAVFNVIIANRDDHAKNHAFMMDAGGEWRLTPAYDVTPSEGPGGEHSMAICGEGRAPGRRDLMQLARTASIKGSAAEAIIDHVGQTVSNFAEIAVSVGLSEVGAADLKQQSAKISKRFAGKAKD